MDPGKLKKGLTLICVRRLPIGCTTKGTGKTQDITAFIPGEKYVVKKNRAKEYYLRYNKTNYFFSEYRYMHNIFAISK